jgi:hypothetical protein
MAAELLGAEEGSWSFEAGGGGDGIGDEDAELVSFPKCPA